MRKLTVGRGVEKFPKVWSNENSDSFLIGNYWSVVGFVPMFLELLKTSMDRLIISETL